MNALITLDDLTLHNAEPCIQDSRLAEALRFEHLPEIRRLIKRNLKELETHGEVCGTITQTSPKGGRPGIEYLLNEAQALLICMFSRTDRAAEVRKVLIDVFLQWYRGGLDGKPLIFDAQSLQETGQKMAILREYRLLFGPAVARRMCPMLGLPDVSPALADQEDYRPHECLGLILEDARPLIESGDVHGLAAMGCKLVDVPEGALFVANCSPGLERLLAGTDYDQKRWMRILRRLSGAIGGRAAGRESLEGVQVRGTVIPAHYLDLRADEV